MHMGYDSSHGDEHRAHRQEHIASVDASACCLTWFSCVATPAVCTLRATICTPVAQYSEGLKLEESTRRGPGYTRISRVWVYRMKSFGCL